MAKAQGEPMVAVIARHRGQQPDGTWVQPGDAFEVPRSKVSKRWMDVVPPRSGKGAALVDPEA